MIDLTPIAKNIQKRLFEKMKLLGRSESSTVNTRTNTSELNLQKLSNKSTFIRMTSALDNPVVLMAGELNDDGSVAQGYEDIYGTRGDTENKFKRPMPGIKSIDVTFKGGERALREATISWTCWSFEEVNRLSPHFLHHGSEVLLEWGWIYDEHTLKKLPTFYDFKNSKIKDGAYENYQQKVIDNFGDFDMMVGQVKNFEYTTREDGAFDCQTIITSVGISIIENTQPTKETANSGTYYKVKENESLIDLKRKLREKKDKPEELIDFDTSVSFETFLKHLDTYLLDYVYKPSGRNPRRGGYNQIYPRVTVQSNKEKIRLDTTRGGYDTRTVLDYLSVVPNEFIIEFTERPRVEDNTTKSAWVRWGWFEDNILSKFTTIVSDNPRTPPITIFRSVENELDDDGKPTNTLESTLVRNHKLLETVNINKYLIPGQFSGFNPSREYKLATIDDETGKFKIAGDSFRIQALSTLTNDYFRKFSANEEKTYGYLRSLLVNTDLIREAFGVSKEQDKNIRFLNYREAMENLFRLIQDDLVLWSFNFQADQISTNRVKIVDNNVVNFNFKSNTNINDKSIQDKSSISIYSNETDEVVNNGVFFFPVWRHDSIVKRQNITAKVPNSMALATMYGDGYDKLSTLQQAPPDIQEVEGIVMASLNKSKDSQNKNRKDVKIALRGDDYKKLGTQAQGINIPAEFIGPTRRRLGTQEDFIKADRTTLLRNGGNHDIKDWLKNNSNKLQEVYKDKIKYKTEQIRALENSDQLGYTNTLDLSTPLPVPETIEAEYPRKFKKLIQGKKYGGKRYSGGLDTVLNSKYAEDGRMKQNFIDYISQAIALDSGDRQISETDLPLILPLEMELEIDGIGGILPSNSFHSTYLTNDYQKYTVFQIFDVGHGVSSDGWTVSIRGLMRTTLAKVQDDSTSKDIDIKQLLNDIRKGQRKAISDAVFERSGEYFSPANKKRQGGIRTVEADLKEVT